MLVVTEHKTAVLTLKKSPYLGADAEREVFVTGGGVASRRTVRFGLVGYDRTEVLEGLSEGDEVIISDVTGYRHLERVELR